MTFQSSMISENNVQNNVRETFDDDDANNEELRLTRRTIAQLRTNKSPFFKSHLHKVDAKSHPSPLCPSVTITHTTHIISSTAPTYIPQCHPWIC